MAYYERIAEYYDLLMDAGYYNHASLARIVQSTVGEGKRILELGVGTGGLAQELIKLDPSCNFTGIDFSPAMVEIAQDRLPDDVAVVECDVAEMDLGQKFDAAVSCGGTWVMVDRDREYELGTHLFNRDKDIAGLHRVAEHLEPDAQLLLSIHPPHADKEIKLENDIVYCQTIEDKKEGADHYSLEKTYAFKRDSKTLTEETLTLGFYKPSMYEALLADAGFTPQNVTEEGKFFVFEKTGE